MGYSSSLLSKRYAAATAAKRPALRRVRDAQRVRDAARLAAHGHARGRPARGAAARRRRRRLALAAALRIVRLFAVRHASPSREGEALFYASVSPLPRMPVAML